MDTITYSLSSISEHVNGIPSAAPHYVARAATPEEIATAQQEVAGWAEEKTWSRAQRAAEWDRLDDEGERGPVQQVWIELARLWHGRRALPTVDQLSAAVRALPGYQPPPAAMEEPDEEDDAVAPEPTLVEHLHYLMTLAADDPISGRRARLIRAAMEEVAPTPPDPASGGQTAAGAAPEAQLITGSTAGLVFLRTEAGAVRPLLANAELALRRDWPNVLAYDQFALRVTILQEPPPWLSVRWLGAGVGEPWTDNDDRLTAIWLQRKGIFVGDEIAGKAVQTVARDHRIHPVREYLGAIRWDGTDRIDAWLTTYLGVPSNPYTTAMGARWLIAAIARICQPGCKADCCMILEGPQGVRKSTALRTLASPWFSDEIAELGSKDAALQTRGVWLIELSELESMTGAEVARVKSFMSRGADRFRPPYGRQLIDSPRQCIFAGTVNHGTYLKDETGGRRFWPAVCGEIRIEELARDRDQLWAESLVRYRAGHVWWLESLTLNQLASEEQESRYEGDAWDEAIAQWVQHPIVRIEMAQFGTTPSLASTPESVSLPEILLHAIGKRPEHWTQPDKNRVARTLRSLGYERYRDRIGNLLQWRYRKRP